jgi:hypothetical protein
MIDKAIFELQIEIEACNYAIQQLCKGDGCMETKTQIVVDILKNVF